MTEKLTHLKEELRHQNILLTSSDRAMRESPEDSSLHDLFKNQVSRIAKEIQRLEKELLSIPPLSKYKPSKGKKKNVKVSKKPKKRK